MSGLIGWIDSAANAVANETLASATKAAGILTDTLILGASSISTTLAAWQTYDAAYVHNSGSNTAAIVGQAHWDIPELQKLAEQNGIAASLVEAYRIHGSHLLEHLHGTFALAIIDTQAQTVILAIDRMGIQPLAFAKTSTGIVFSSDARAVAAYPSVDDTLSPQNIFNYLFFHMVPSPGSIFSGVEKLLPGEYLVWQQGQLTRNFYWRLVYQNGVQENQPQKAEKLKSLLTNAIQTAKSSDQVGTFLSGGLDSSTVTGFLAKNVRKPVDTFTIGFDAAGFDEMEYARITSRHFGTQPHEYYLTPDDIVSAIPKIAATYDEPFGNDSVIPTYYCAKLAKENGIKMLLAGDGGDEIFGGNARYAKQKIFEIYWQIPSWARQHLIEPFSQTLPGIGLLNKVKSYVAQARIPLPERFETYNFLHRDPLEQILTPEFLSQVSVIQPESLLREVYHRTQSPSYLDKMLHLDLKFTLADNDLRKVNRACELAGIAVGYPMLDEGLVAFSANLTPDEKVRGQNLRYFFKKSLGDFLPKEIINKSKHGFGLPFGLWMQTHPELKALAYDSLSALRRRNIIQPSYIDQLLYQHNSGHATYYGVMIWVLMMLEQWLQVQHQSHS